MNLCKTRAAVSWILQIIAAVILLQTLFFKFTGAPESIYIFKTLGLEPWGRIGTGIVELIASVLLLTPRTVTIGAIIGLGVISGAIFSHLTKLGIVVMDDGGLLFGLALAVFGCCAMVLFMRRAEIPVVGAYFRSTEETGSAHSFL
jgi:putative oxidoreductase